MPHGHTQAVLKIVPRGGTKTPGALKKQWDYLSRRGEEAEQQVRVERSGFYHNVELDPDDFQQQAQSWAEQTGNWRDHGNNNGGQDLTTHMVISFPPGTDRDNSKLAALAWAEEMFGGHDGRDRFDYVSMFHTDRDHPHMHLVVNRRGNNQDWLKISRRDPVMNYDTMRQKLAQASQQHGINLHADPRPDRGIFMYPRREPAPADDLQIPERADTRFYYKDLPDHVNRTYPLAAQAGGGGNDESDSDDDAADNHGGNPANAANGQGAAPADQPANQRRRGNDGTAINVPRVDANGAGPSGRNPNLDVHPAPRADGAGPSRLNPPAGPPLGEQNSGHAQNALQQNQLQEAALPDGSDDDNAEAMDIDNAAPDADANQHNAAPQAQVAPVAAVQDVDMAGPIPNTRVLRSDTAKRQREEDEAAMHLRNGKIIKKSRTESDRNDNGHDR